MWELGGVGSCCGGAARHQVNLLRCRVSSGGNLHRKRGLAAVITITLDLLYSFGAHGRSDCVCTFHLVR